MTLQSHSYGFSFQAAIFQHTTRKRHRQSDGNFAELIHKSILFTDVWLLIAVIYDKYTTTAKRLSSPYRLT